MRIGLSLPQMGAIAEPDRVGEFAARAEELGYDSLWAQDRILTPLRPSPVYPGFTPEQPWPPEQARVADPIVALTLAASVTSRVRLSTSTFNATWHHPLFLARTFTSLDLLSQGRLDLGFGIGWMRTEYEALGIPFAGRGARLEEIIVAMRTIWADDPFEHDGELWQIPPSRLELRPFRPGGPPLLLGGYGAEALKRVGRLADGWLPAATAADGLQVEALAQIWELVRHTAASAGRDPDTLRRELRVNTSPGRPVDDAVRVALTARDAGYEGAFIDLHYIATGTDHALELAARAKELYERG
ncbi:TIGR03619 family F420-dependent LLM class oxidoreductase [Streptosporangium sp. NPDC002721]|uniref:TIGR03619 family F420-dependent LLM class oxidoreductase n=1 Tax=Streptosporangium sp. NPDC002721 TaxID=3366188 RepID=UPI003692CE2F